MTTPVPAPNGYLPGVITGEQFNSFVQQVIDDNALVDQLSGVSAAIGGSPLAAFASTSANTTVTGATTSMVAVASPTAYPGIHVDWQGYVVAADIVQVVVTNTSNATVTPASSIYNIRVIV